MDVVALQDRIRIKSHSPPLDFRRAGGMTLELVFARRCQEQGGFVLNREGLLGRWPACGWWELKRKGT